MPTDTGVLWLLGFVVLVITAVSGIWQAYETRVANRYYAEGNLIARGEAGKMENVAYRPSRWPQLVMLVLTVLTWSAVGYDVYDRHRQAINPDWIGYQYKDIWNETFIGETVLVDGKSFHNCKFNDVTFDYEGSAPFQ